MWALLLLPIVLLVLYFAQRLLFRRLWDENLTVQISFDRDYIFCGEESNLVETIVNNKYLPLPVLEVGFDMSRWVVFQDEENSTVSDMTYRRDVFTASVRQRITRTLPVRGKKRGYYRIASTTVTSYDFLMTEKQVAHFLQETEFYVLPAHISASHIRIPYSKIMGLLVSRRRVYDDPFEFAGIRDYRRSDPMKYINWKASARGGTLLVNQHDSTLSQKVTVLLDCTGIGSAVTDALNETAKCSPPASSPAATPHFTCAAGSQDWNAATTSPPCRSFSAPCTTAHTAATSMCSSPRSKSCPFCRIWKP